MCLVAAWRPVRLRSGQTAKPPLAFLKSSTRGRTGERPPHLSTSSLWFPLADKPRAEWILPICFVSFTDMAPSHLWLGAMPSSFTLFYFTCRNSPRSREATFKAMGLQSYSRLLWLSRGKHHRLYLQQ